VQLPRIQHNYLTRLDKLLSVFEQTNFVDDKKIIKSYNHTIDELGVKEMTDILHYIGTDPAEKKLIEDEQEAWRTVDAMWQEKSDELQGVIKSQAKAILDKEKVILDKEKVILDKEKTLKEQKELIDELKRKLNEK
jgi:hypothetical protein